MIDNLNRNKKAPAASFLFIKQNRSPAFSMCIFHVASMCRWLVGWSSTLNYLRHLRLLTPLAALKSDSAVVAFPVPIFLVSLLHLVRRFLLLGQGDFVESLMDALHEEREWRDVGRCESGSELKSKAFVFCDFFCATNSWCPLWWIAKSKHSPGIQTWLRSMGLANNLTPRWGRKSAPA